MIWSSSLSALVGFLIRRGEDTFPSIRQIWILTISLDMQCFHFKTRRQELNSVEGGMLPCSALFATAIQF